MAQNMCLACVYPQRSNDINHIFFALHIYSSGLRSLEFKFLGAENFTVYTGSDLEIEGQPHCWDSVLSFPLQHRVDI